MPIPYLTPAAYDSWLTIYGDGADQGGDDGFTVLATGTASAGNVNSFTVTGGGLTKNAFHGHTLIWTSGPNVGTRRTVRNNSTTDIYVMHSYGSAVANGHTFKIVEPGVKFETPDLPLRGQRLSYGGFGSDWFDDPGLFLINVKFTSSSGFANYKGFGAAGLHVFMAGVEFDGTFIISFIDSRVRMGDWLYLRDYNTAYDTGNIELGISEWADYFQKIGEPSNRVENHEWHGWGLSRPASDIPAYHPESTFDGEDVWYTGYMATTVLYGYGSRVNYTMTLALVGTLGANRDVQVAFTGESGSLRIVSGWNNSARSWIECANNQYKSGLFYNYAAQQIDTIVHIWNCDISSTSAVEDGSGLVNIWGRGYLESVTIDGGAGTALTVGGGSVVEYANLTCTTTGAATAQSGMLGAINSPAIVVRNGGRLVRATTTAANTLTAIGNVWVIDGGELTHLIATFTGIAGNTEPVLNIRTGGRVFGSYKLQNASTNTQLNLTAQSSQPLAILVAEGSFLSFNNLVNSVTCPNAGLRVASNSEVVFARGGGVYTVFTGNVANGAVVVVEGGSRLSEVTSGELGSPNLTFNGSCTITNTSTGANASALIVRSGGIANLKGTSSMQAILASSGYGVDARGGGRVYFAAQPTVVQGVTADLTVGTNPGEDQPDTALFASFSAIVSANTLSVIARST